MKNFNEFISKGSQEPAPGIEIGGSFGCQSCSEIVDGATWDMPRLILNWKCSQGHVSFIKDFSL